MDTATPIRSGRGGGGRCDGIGEDGAEGGGNGGGNGCLLGERNANDTDNDYHMPAPAPELQVVASKCHKVCALLVIFHVLRLHPLCPKFGIEATNGANQSGI